MKKVIISGCCGTMGKVIASLCNGNDFTVVAGVDGYICKKGSYSFPIYKKFEEIDEKADVIIDFSHPSMLDALLEYSKKNHLPVVIATTGYSEKEVEKIEEASENIPILFSYNMSVGINLLCELAKTAAKIIGNDFDIEIIEKHHNRKIDAPSGTAILIANTISESLDKKMNYEYDRHSKRIKRSKNEIGIHSVRGGTIVGEHEVIFAGHDEVLSIKHQAASREIFANGALNAAKFISEKSAGIYTMKDLIENS